MRYLQQVCSVTSSANLLCHFFILNYKYKNCLSQEIIHHFKDYDEGDFSFSKLPIQDTKSKSCTSNYRLRMAGLLQFCMKSKIQRGLSTCFHDSALFIPTANRNTVQKYILYSCIFCFYDSIISIVTRLHAGRSGVRIPANAKKSVIYTALYTTCLATSIFIKTH
jgi:hypothetical protein